MSNFMVATDASIDATICRSNPGKSALVRLRIMMMRMLVERIFDCNHHRRNDVAIDTDASTHALLCHRNTRLDSDQRSLFYSRFLRSEYSQVMS